ncbi:MAG: methylglyoxal synthase [Bacteroidetes bacterium]|nr:methylglyoxal synthase [Bacteroidota bacterium]
MNQKKRIALVAHDNCKQELLEWIEENFEHLIPYHLVCTGTTGQLVEEKLKKCVPQNNNHPLFNITKLKSGPLGGDQQLGALICNGEVDILIFFWDAMEPQAHDVDIKALLRLATLYNIVYACSRSTADFIITSPLFHQSYQPLITEKIENYSNRILS